MIKEINALLENENSVVSTQRAELALIHLKKILPIGEKALKTRQEIQRLRLKPKLSKRQQRRLKVLEFRMIDCLAQFHEDISWLQTEN